jgi:hypothetical protein
MVNIVLELAFLGDGRLVRDDSWVKKYHQPARLLESQWQKNHGHVLVLLRSKRGCQAI